MRAFAYGVVVRILLIPLAVIMFSLFGWVSVSATFNPPKKSRDRSDWIYNPVEIHLQYLPDSVLLARAWHHTRPHTEESPAKLALAGLQHTAHASVEVGQGQSLEVVQQNCQHQKGFCTQVVEGP